MTPFEILEWVEHSSPAECRELADLLNALAQLPRNADWAATCRIARTKFPQPTTLNRAAVLAEARRRVHEDRQPVEAAHG